VLVRPPSPGAGPTSNEAKRSEERFRNQKGGLLSTDRCDTTTCRENTLSLFFSKRKTRQHMSTIDQEVAEDPRGSQQRSYLLPSLPAVGQRVDGGRLPSALLHGSFLLLDALR
jgi:hypothetical protein